METNSDTPGQSSKDDNDSNALNEGASLEYDSDNSPVKSENELDDKKDTSVKSEDGAVDASNGKTEGKKKRDTWLWRFWNHFNLYIVLFVLLVVIAGVITTLIYLHNRSTTVIPAGTITQQNLPASTLQDLAKSGIQVGDPKQVLNIQSNSVFAGAVLVKGELQIAGGLKIGTGSLAIPEVNISNSATINQIQAQTIGVAGATRTTDLSVLHNLSVNGSGTFNGGLTTSTLAVGKLQLNGDLQLTRHIQAGGATPGRSNGNAIGSGGTTTVSGSDTAGSVTINTGSGPAAGCFLTVNFVNGFSGLPHIVITPVGSAAAGLSYYINRSSSNFSICTTTPAPGNTSFGFDYHTFE